MWMPSPSESSAEILLAEVGWLRRLARSLVADPNLAEDLAQRTVLAALEHPPSDDRSLRGWLRRVLVNFLHQERRAAGRREDRERRVARAEAYELTDRVAVHRKVVDAVVALEEPYRTAILLRFFEGLPPRAIARRQGIPVSTAKSHLARGLDRLRGRLDSLHGGDRGAWLAALTPLAFDVPLSGPALVGASLVSSKAKIALAFALLLAFAAGIAYVNRPGPDAAPPATEIAKAPPAAAVAAGAAESATELPASRAATPAVAEAFPPEYERALSGIVGRVVEPTGEPVEGAVVELVAGLADLIAANVDQLLFEPESFRVRFDAAKATTGRDGRFRFARVDPRVHYLLGVNLGGLPRPRIRLVDRAPGPGETADLGDVALDPMVVLAGRVVDESGEGVAGARVRATNLPAFVFQAGGADVGPGSTVLARFGRASLPPFVWRLPTWAKPLFAKLPFPATTTGPDGSFRLAGAPAGSITLLVDGAGIPPAHRGPFPSGGAAAKDVGRVVVARGAEIEGVVVDERDRPVGGAHVLVGAPFAIASESASFVVFGEPLTAAEDGTFHARVASRQVVLAARGPDAADWTFGEPIDVSGERLRMHVPAPRSALVHVRDSAGAPIDARIATQRFVKDLSLLPQLEPPIAAKVERVELGVARIRGLQQDRYVVYAQAPGFAVGRARLETSAEGETEVDLVLEPERRVQVRVFGTKDGRPAPIEDARVFASSEVQGEPLGFLGIASARTDAEGRAAVPTRGEGKVALFATHPAYATTRTEVQVPATGETTIQLALGGSIEGRVHRGNEPPGEPRLIAVSGDDDLLAKVPRTTVTDADGRFALSHLAPGARYSVRALPRWGDLAALSPLEIQGLESASARAKCSVADGKTTVVDLDLATAGRPPKPDDGRIRGHVVVNGEPAAGDFISAAGAEAVPPKEIDASGAFDLGPVAPGGYALSLRRRRDPLSSAIGGWPVRVAAGETKFADLTAVTGKIRGVVRGPDGTPIAQARVRPRPVRKNGDPLSVAGMGTRTNADGSYEIGEIAAGSYRISVSTLEYPETIVDAEVPASGAAVVDVTIEGGASVDGRVDVAGEIGVANLVFRRASGEGEHGPYGELVAVEKGTGAFR
ncbi:MAG TPA: sigma-70 family RNA polymerase sigma factor, partial [Planctomycetota bacterium]|nr:sigma-70 family RNA polymerase sigma factor [Planctomycetota bacterium]